MNEEIQKALFEAIRPDNELIRAVKQHTEPAKQPRRALRPVAAAAALIAVALVALFGRAIFFNRNQPPVIADPTLAVELTGISYPIMPTNFYSPEKIPRQADGSVRCADISVDGKEGMAMPSSSALMSIAPFSESMVKDGVLCFEGTVVETHFKQYDFKTDYGIKFGKRAIIHYTPVSQITTFCIEKVWYGDPALVGTAITLEDESGTEDGTFGYRLGVPYVVIVQKMTRTGVSDGWDETLTEGDNTRDSAFSTYYPFQPQIERTRHGMYIVPTSWKTVTADAETVVRLDEETPISGYNQSDFEYYKDQLRLIDRETFLVRMEAVVGSD